LLQYIASYYQVKISIAYAAEGGLGEWRKQTGLGRMNMAEFRTGAMVGGVAGIIYGALFGVSGLAIMLAFGAKLEQLIGPSVAGLDTVALILIFIISGIIVGVAVGAIFGVAYAALYRVLPGNTSLQKGAIFSIIFWLTGLVFSRNTFRILGETTIVTILVIHGLITALIWGVLVGAFWDKFSWKSIARKVGPQNLEP